MAGCVLLLFLAILCLLGTCSHAHVLSNGLRAPPWRQVHGDLGYIIVKASDVAPFYVVANVNGFWQIKVLWAFFPFALLTCSSVCVQGPGEGGAMDDEKIGDTYATLSALLRAKSPHFAATIDSHVCPLSHGKRITDK